MEPDAKWPDFLANCGTFAAAIASNSTHSRSFLEGRYADEDFTTWRAETRSRFLDLLHYSPPATPLAPELISKTDCGAFVLESLSIATSPWSRVLCDLLVPEHPRDGQWPAPGIVGIHCHGGAFRWGREKIVERPEPELESPTLVSYREKLYGGRAFANELAKRGYVVAVIDGFYFGDRRLRYRHGDWPEPYRVAEAALSPDSDEWFDLLNQVHQDMQPRVAGALFQAGATWPGVFLSDDRRTIDYLLSRTEVDPERIGCVGLSVGGVRSGFLAAADERIKAAISVGWLCGLGDLLPVGRWPHSVGWVHYVPGMFQEFDLPDVAALTCPRALLIMQGRGDTLFPLDGVVRALDHVRAVYEKAGAGDRFTGRLVDGPHQFGPRLQDDAFDWLDQSL